MQTVRVAFYKSYRGNWFDKTIGLFERYSHVEIQVNNVCWSSSPRDEGFRAKVIDIYDGKWDILQITADVNLDSFLMECTRLHGKKYDWTVILNYIGIKYDFCKDRVWCGEAITTLYNAALNANISKNATLENLYEEIWNTKKYTDNIIRY